MPSNLLVSFPLGSLFAQAHPAEQGVLPELALHRERGGAQAVLRLLGSHVVKEGVRGVLLVSEAAEAHAQPADCAVAVADLVVYL